MKNFAAAGLNKYRLRHGITGSTDELGNFGTFIIPLDDKTAMCVLANDGLPECDHWEHVSLHIKRRNELGKWINRLPTWNEMCKAKELFWEDDECVMQLHPPKTDYINHNPHVLHLWRPENQTIPRPPQILV